MSDTRVKYSDVFCDWLVELGYTHCFFVAGGNIMHLLDSCRVRFSCVPVVHEVAAGIATEYFNESEGQGKAFALVTAGPGLTNIVTAVAGAYLENRDLLVIGGTVKSSDLATGGLRQRGIQEVDGVALCEPITVVSERIAVPATQQQVYTWIQAGLAPRRGPVFLEMCLDAQGAPVAQGELQDGAPPRVALPEPTDRQLEGIGEAIKRAERPVLLIGGGVSRDAARAALPGLSRLGVPLLTTYNGADRVPSDHPLYVGRPNTWGMRRANVVLQQADLVLALGTRLGMQQTGFQWQEFAPLAEVIQVEIDAGELEKGHPAIDQAVQADANAVLAWVAGRRPVEIAPWRQLIATAIEKLPLAEAVNEHAPGFHDPYEFYLALSAIADGDDVVIPCSSGGSFTVFYQSFLQRAGQVLISDKSLASMGYGLSGAIGAGLAHPGRRVLHAEGDGGFAQNLQELGTVRATGLPIKTFLFVNEGYASIRMTQRNYFGGEYLGCDTATGLGFPDWPALFASFGIPTATLGDGWATDTEVQHLLRADGPAGFIVPIDPEQTYWPKITSRVTADGSMASNPLHHYSPELPADVASAVIPYFSEA